MIHPRKVLTTQQMGAVDRATIEAGIPGIVLMENAAARVVEYIAENILHWQSIGFWWSAARGTTAATAWPSRGSSTSGSGRVIFGWFLRPATMN